MSWKRLVPVIGLVLAAAACSPEPGLVIEPVSSEISPEGGEVIFPNGVSITFPEGAVAAEGEVSISVGTDGVDEYGLPQTTPVFSFEIPGGELLEPVRLAFPLPEDVDLDLENFQVYHLDDQVPGTVDLITGEGGPPEWVPLPTRIEDGYVVAWTDSFSDFIVHNWLDEEQITFDMTPSIAPEYVPGTDLAASVSGEMCVRVEEWAGERVHVYANLMLDEGWLKHDTVLDSLAPLVELDQDGCFTFDYAFDEDITNRVDGRSRFKVYVHMEVHSWGSSPEMSAELDGYYMHFLESTSRSFVVRTADSPQIVVAPIVAIPGQSFTVEGEFFHPDDPVVISWGGASGVELANIVPGTDGSFRAAARVPLDTPSEWYTITASNESGSLTASEEIGIMEPPEEEVEEEVEVVEESAASQSETCLELTLLDEGSGFVLLTSPAQPTYQLTYLVEDRCGTAGPEEWVTVNDMTALAQVELEDGRHLKVSLDRGTLPAGTYMGTVGLHYPGNGRTSTSGLVVEVADLEYVYPNTIHTNSTLHHAWGKNSETTDQFTCSRVDEASVPENERFIVGSVVVDCPEGHEDWEEEWEYMIDRLTGVMLYDTCENCFSNLNPDPFFQGPEGTYAGYLVPTTTVVLEDSWEASEVNTDTTQGVWTWVETTTRTFDGITGRWVEVQWVGKKLFTGTYNGQELSNADYGYWRRGGWQRDTSLLPLGYAALEDDAVEEEIPEELPEQDCGADRVPDIVAQGLSLSEAGALLDSLGYSYTWEDRYLGAEDVGLIVDQAPSAGFCGAPENTILVLTRNRGEP